MSTAYHEFAIGIHFLNLSGPLNIGKAEDVIQLFREMSEQGIQRVVVNLEDVPFIDGRGLAALIAGYKIFGGDGQNFRLAGIQDQPRLVFELTGFDRVFQIYEGVTSELPARSHRQTQPSTGALAFVPQLAALDTAA